MSTHAVSSSTTYLGHFASCLPAYLLDHWEQAKSKYCLPFEVTFTTSTSTSSILREMTGSSLVTIICRYDVTTVPRT